MISSRKELDEMARELARMSAGQDSARETAVSADREISNDDHPHNSITNDDDNDNDSNHQR